MMCDTSLTRTPRAPRAVAGQVPDGRTDTRGAALTSANEETDKVITTAVPVTATYPQFGPVVDLAYTRWRATW